MTNRNHVLVTGGSGLLGSSLVHLLIEEGRERPVVLDINPDPKRLADVMDRIEYIKDDVASPEVLNSVIQKIRPSKIYHFAAFLGDGCEENPMEGLRINVNGFMHLLEAARGNGAPQVLFSSSLGTYGMDLEDGAVLTDLTLQRPFSFYGVTKLFSEGAGRFYKRKYGLDFRGIRYPAIVGPGVRAGGIVTYTSAMIEHSAKGEPCTVAVAPETRLAVVHVEDAARAMIDLGRPPVERIRMTTYLINGVTPTPSAAEMAETVKKRLPNAKIDFKPDPEWDKIIKLSARPVDDGYARSEWGWQPRYDTYEKVMDSYLAALG